MNWLKIGIPSFLFFMIAACSSFFENDNSEKNKPLPQTAKKIVIRWHSDGGMLPESENIYISTDSSYWSMWRYDYEQKIYFNTSQNEIDKLYTVFLQNKFDKIRVIDETEVYDRGGTSLDITADNIYVQVSNSGMSFIAEKSWINYSNIEREVCDFTFQKIESTKIPVVINFSKKLRLANYIFNVSINGETHFNTKSDSFPNKLNLLLFPGDNKIEFYRYHSDSLNSYGTNLIIDSKQFIHPFSEENNTLNFDFNESVIIEKKK